MPGHFALGHCWKRGAMIGQDQGCSGGCRSLDLSHKDQPLPSPPLLLPVLLLFIFLRLPSKKRRQIIPSATSHSTLTTLTPDNHLTGSSLASSRIDWGSARFFVNGQHRHPRQAAESHQRPWTRTCASARPPRSTGMPHLAPLGEPEAPVETTKRRGDTRQSALDLALCTNHSPIPRSLVQTERRALVEMQAVTMADSPAMSDAPHSRSWVHVGPMSCCSNQTRRARRAGAGKRRLARRKTGQLSLPGRLMRGRRPLNPPLRLPWPVRWTTSTFFASSALGVPGARCPMQAPRVG